MVEEQIRARGLRDPAVLEAMRTVPRHLFAGPGSAEVAYGDHPLPLGSGQTLSQPYVVALMAELAGLAPGDRVLEIGTGSGYSAAVLAGLDAEVWSIEILAELGRVARANLAAAGCRGVHLRVGDGYEGWPAAAPFDAILLTAAPRAIPPPLFDQLAEGGRLVAPVGGWNQELLRIRRTKSGLERRAVIPVRFVPMTGKALKESESRD